ncbi:MAG: hypothetical protein JXB42_04450, partial [Deltaproteobacteria bacterium]|nr:hypothetical protein [Deltaproteobacteria bacterium]
RIHVQGTSLALSRVEGAPHKFTPMPGVHLSFQMMPKTHGTTELFVRQEKEKTDMTTCKRVVLTTVVLVQGILNW